MTILRDQRTTRGDFIFYADRLSTLIVEKALELIPHCPKKVQTPLKVNFEGVTQTNDVRYVSSLVVWRLPIGIGWSIDSTVRRSILVWSTTGHSGCPDWSYAYPV